MNKTIDSVLPVYAGLNLEQPCILAEDGVVLPVYAGLNLGPPE